jgi:hypothetical protein
MKQHAFVAAAALLLGWFSCVYGESSGQAIVPLTNQQALAIGKKIWENECGCSIQGLTSWNKGETFASLGIGHFIWYPKGQDGPFEESFPQMLAFLKAKGVYLPDWLDANTDCPWNTREEFMAALDNSNMIKLRNILASTAGLQALFAADRMEASFAKILKKIPKEQHRHIETQFRRVAAHPQGVYALMDYVNFKGEGIAPAERYQGEGWGLLQVLETMTGVEPGASAVTEFADAAAKVLRRRVANSPPARNEQRWLKGWIARCETYRP